MAVARLPAKRLAGGLGRDEALDPIARRRAQPRAHLRQRAADDRALDELRRERESDVLEVPGARAGLELEDVERVGPAGRRERLVAADAGQHRPARRGLE